MKVALYVRVSTQRQAQTQTIEDQLQRLTSYIEDKQWVLDDDYIFRDDGYSGAKLNRPALNRLRDKVRSQSVNLVLLTAPDRLARNYVHQVLLIEEMENSGCTIEFIDRPMSREPDDQLMLQIRGAVAEYERTLITERMRRGREMKMRTGRLLPWTIPPFGYCTDPEHPRDPAGVRIDESAAAIVVEIFQYYGQEGATIRQVADRLQAHGFAPPRGKGSWAGSTIRGILVNPVYTGVVYGNRMCQSAIKRRLPLKPGQTEHGRQNLPAEEWIEVAKIPAIISPQQYQIVQRKLAHNKAQASRNNKQQPYLLRAMVSCGQCRLAVTGRLSDLKHAYYRCNGRKDLFYSRQQSRCNTRWIPAKYLDELVWQDLSEVIMHPKSIANAMERAHAGNWIPQQLQARLTTLRKAQHSLKQQLERLTDAYLDGVILLTEYKRRRAEIADKEQAFISQEQQLMAQAQSQEQLTVMIRSMEEFCQRVQQSLASATFEQKRTLVELLIDRVVVTNEVIEIRYLIPTSPSSENTRFSHLCSHYQPRSQDLGPV
jgi:site-specific DNA recombinase